VTKGVNELDEELVSLVPKAFVEVMVNVYAWFAANDPLTIIDPSKSVSVYVKDIDGLELIDIEVIGAPLLEPSV
jgi:hypothetical protein